MKEQFENEMKLEFLSKSSNEAFARITVAAFASQLDPTIEELADMLEIIKALANLENKTLNDVIFVAEQKSKKRGAFDEKIYLEKVVIDNK